MDGPVHRAAFGVSRVPLTCTALYYFIGTMHCTAVKAMSLQGRRPSPPVAVPPLPLPPRWRPWFEEGESNARLTSIRPLLGLFLFSVLTPWARIRQGPKTWHKTKIPCESHDMYACFVLILTYFLHISAAFCDEV